jgi:hypothetical protein
MDHPNKRNGLKHMRNRRNFSFSPEAVFGVLMLAGALGAFGQSSAVRSGSLEIGPFIGGSYGIDQFHVMAGGNITYALKNKWVLPYVEYSYFPGIPHTATLNLGGGAALTQHYTLALSDLHAGVHVRIPIGEKPVVPYLVFGMGGMLYPSRTDTFTGTINGATITQTSPASGGADFTINGGGGIRYYLGKSGTYGFRTEAKFYKIMNGDFSGTTFGKVELGFFIQIH